MKVLFEWVKVIYCYFGTLKDHEKKVELILPAVVGGVVSGIYWNIEGTLAALLKLRDLLPTTLAILIGFTINCITILASSDSKNIEDLKNKLTDLRAI